jgi:HD-GYP domain-containing protein (c-di-GMP phosphodiesterase class II)
MATLSYQEKSIHKKVGLVLFIFYLFGYYFFNYSIDSFEIRLLMYEGYTILLLGYILLAKYKKEVDIKVYSRFFDMLIILSLIQHVIRLFRFLVADVGDDLLANNFDAFNTLILGIIALLRTNGIFGLYNNKYAQNLIKSNQEIERRSLDLIERLSVAAEYKDNDTGDHVKRMSSYSKFLALKLGYSEEEATLLEQAAPMHDVGKIGISELIINKPGKLDKEEWIEMMKHCNIGSEILGSHTDKLLSLASVVALQHHEKWNGSGYPNKLKEHEIDLNARIVSVADVYDALTSERPYKKAWTKEKVVKLFEEERDCYIVASQAYATKADFR